MGGGRKLYWRDERKEGIEGRRKGEKILDKKKRYDHKIDILRVSGTGTGEVAQWLRALGALPKDTVSIPSNYMASYNHL